MILKHPLSNKTAIEKYKDRKVIIYHGLNNLWFGYNGLVSQQKEAEIITFKNALKRTKSYKIASNIQYHFIDELGQRKSDIKDFDKEEIYMFPDIRWDEYKKQTSI